MKRVYVAGPMFSSGRLTENLFHAYDAADQLIVSGFAPYLPQLCVQLDISYPKDEEVWLKLDKVWLLQCDALLRLRGVSRGADLEVKWAEEAGIPVFYDFSDLLTWRNSQ